eukprot:620275_1
MMTMMLANGGHNSKFNMQTQWIKKSLKYCNMHLQRHEEKKIDDIIAQLKKIEYLGNDEKRRKKNKKYLKYKWQQMIEYAASYRKQNPLDEKENMMKKKKKKKKKTTSAAYTPTNNRSTRTAATPLRRSTRTRRSPLHSIDQNTESNTHSGSPCDESTNNRMQQENNHNMKSKCNGQSTHTNNRNVACMVTSSQIVCNSIPGAVHLVFPPTATDLPTQVTIQRGDEFITFLPFQFHSMMTEMSKQVSNIETEVRGHAIELSKQTRVLKNTVSSKPQSSS